MPWRAPRALLGDEADAARYAAIAEEVRRAFLDEYVTPSGRMVSDAQTAYAMAIVFEIAPDLAASPALGDRLAELTRESGYRIGTGFVGTPIIQDALTRTGHLDTARRLLVQTENPSWLYPVTMGATTIWERWDSMLPDGTINPGQMTSFNHYAFGAIGDWLHRVVAGLAPDAPGYERIRIAPHPLDGFDSASAEHLTPYGRARAAWTRTGDRIRVEAIIPPNTTATVELPDGRTLEVGSGTHTWEVDAAPAALPPAQVGLDSSLAAVIDDPEAYRVDPRRARGGQARRGARVPDEHAVEARPRSRRGDLPADRPGAAAARSRTDWPSCPRRARSSCDDHHQGGFDMTVSVKDVAAAASVSVGTVSNVLNTPVEGRAGDRGAGARRRSRSSASCATTPPASCAPAGAAASAWSCWMSATRSSRRSPAAPRTAPPRTAWRSSRQQRRAAPSARAPTSSCSASSG